MSATDEPDFARDGLPENSAAFEIAPVSLWLEDFSRLKTLLLRWKLEGMSDVAAYLREDRRRLDACLSAIDIIKVNPQTLILYEVDSLRELLAHLPQVIGPEAMEANVDQIAALFQGERSFSGNVINYSLSGRRLSIRLKGTIIPGHEENWGRVLLAAEDITDLQAARVSAEQNQRYAQTLFEYSPVALWVLDCSNIRKLAEQARRRGVKEIRQPTPLDREISLLHLNDIAVIDVNRRTMNLYGADDKSAFITTGYRSTLITAAYDLLDRLLSLLDGNSVQEREALHRRCDNSELHVHQQILILPGHEDDWLRVQIAETDITSRKKAEAHIKYLRDHDGLTRLYSRDFFYDEVDRLTRVGLYPVSVVVVDLNGLKQANDMFGHSRGDDLLRQVGEMLIEVTPEACTAARVGGDEFAVLLPGFDEKEGEEFLQSIVTAVTRTRNDSPVLELSISIGAATCQPSEALPAAIGRADAEMYRCKLRHYGVSGFSQLRRRVPCLMRDD